MSDNDFEYPWDDDRVRKLEDISLRLTKSAYDGEPPHRFESTISATGDGGYEVKFVGPNGKERVTYIDRETLASYVIEANEAAHAIDRWATKDEALEALQKLYKPMPELIIPPGSKLLKWSRFIFPKNFAEGEITETVNDMQREYIESIAENRKWHPKWVCIRGYMSFGLCVFCWLCGRVGKRIADAWKGANPS